VAHVASQYVAPGAERCNLLTLALLDSGRWQIMELVSRGEVVARLSAQLGSEYPNPVR
jgi:hypothetical protein